MDILETHFLQKKTACKLFFKVNLSEHLSNNITDLKIKEKSGWNESSKSQSKKVVIPK